MGFEQFSTFSVKVDRFFRGSEFFRVCRFLNNRQLLCDSPISGTFQSSFILPSSQSIILSISESRTVDFVSSSLNSISLMTAIVGSVVIALFLSSIALFFEFSGEEANARQIRKVHKKNRSDSPNAT
jgi:hypothetical protein